MLYLAHCSYFATRREDAMGHFTCVVDAASAEEAVSAAGELIDQAHARDELSDGTKVYLDDLIEIAELPAGGVVTGFSQMAAPAVVGSITRAVLGDGAGVECYGWGDDEGPREPFRSF